MSGLAGQRLPSFNQIDVDHDGSISQDETLAFLDQVQGRHRHRHAWLGRLASPSYADVSTVATLSTLRPRGRTAGASDLEVGLAAGGAEVSPARRARPFLRLASPTPQPATAPAPRAAPIPPS